MRLRIETRTGEVWAASRRNRTLSGLLVPFDQEGHPAVGPATISVSADAAVTFGEVVALNLDHDDRKVIGRLRSHEITDEGVETTWQLLDTVRATDTLTEVEEGLRTGLSMEAEIDGDVDDAGVFRVTALHINEAASVRRPAFTGAKITDVAATAATNDTPTEDEGEPIVSDETAVTPETVTETPAQHLDASYAPAPAPRFYTTPALPTPGEWLLASVSRDPARMAEMSRRVRAAAPHTFVEDIPGLIPKQIVGPVLHLRDSSAPLFNALGPNVAPAGNSFSVPVVNPELEVAAPAVEKSDVTKQFKVTATTVTMSFIKRAVNISAEAVAYSQPSVLDVAVDELAEAIAIGSETHAASQLQSATGTNAAVAVTDGADVWAKIAGAVATHHAACGRRPDFFVCAPDAWAELAGYTNGLGQQIVQGIGQDLSGVGYGSVFGIPIVVSPQMQAGKAYLVSSAGVKSWAGPTVEMRIAEPTILGYALGAGRAVGLSVASGKFITPITGLGGAAVASSK